MAFRFAATLLIISINTSVLAVQTKMVPKPFVTDSDTTKKSPEDNSVVRTHGTHETYTVEASSNPVKVESPVVRAEAHPAHPAHPAAQAFAVDGNGELEVEELEKDGLLATSAKDVPAVDFKSQPRTPIVIPAIHPKAETNQSAAQESPTPVVRAEAHPAHAAAVADHVSEVGASGEAAPTKSRTRKGKQGLDGSTALDVPAEMLAEPEMVVRVHQDPSALVETKFQVDHPGAQAELHVLLLFLALAMSAVVLSLAGVCGSLFEKPEAKAPRTQQDILAAVYASASGPGIATLSSPSWQPPGTPSSGTGGTGGKGIGRYLSNVERVGEDNGKGMGVVL